MEIEFAVQLPRRPEETATFGFLQIRPLVLSREGEELRIENVDPARLVCHSSKVLGNGRIEDLRDVVVVDSDLFERSRSQVSPIWLSAGIAVAAVLIWGIQI